MLRSSHNTWPVDVSQIKQGFIVVKGHSTVGLQQVSSLPWPSSVLFNYSPFPQLPRELYQYAAHGDVEDK